MERYYEECKYNFRILQERPQQPHLPRVALNYKINLIQVTPFRKGKLELQQMQNREEVKSVSFTIAKQGLNTGLTTALKAQT